MKKIAILIIALMSVTAIYAGEWQKDNEVSLRAGYSLGGTMPIGMPESIRGLNSFKPGLNLQFGADIEHRFAEHWGVNFGLHLENKAMETDAKVKNYRMKMVKADDCIEGNFTGNVVTKTRMWQWAVPVQLAFHPSRKVTVKAGPYIALCLDKAFGGYAYDGYLRQGDPTGPRVELGNTASERGDYEFNDDLRVVNYGVDLGADWYVWKRLGLYADVTWGLNNVFKSNFQTIEQAMHPVYGTIGFVYKLK